MISSLANMDTCAAFRKRQHTASPGMSLLVASILNVCLFNTFGPHSNDSQIRCAPRETFRRRLQCQEFKANTASTPDLTVWKFDLGNNGGWGNNEVEVYSDGSNGSADASVAIPLTVN